MGVGRKALPQAIKELQGTDRTPKDVELAVPVTVMPIAPTNLSEEAQAEWTRVSQELYDLGLLGNVDRAGLAGYCEAWADWVMACNEVKRLGMVIKIDETVHEKHFKNGKSIIDRNSGKLIENPYYSVKKKSAEMMLRFLVEFGMTPSARSRIDIGKLGGPRAIRPKAEKQRRGRQPKAENTSSDTVHWAKFGNDG
jgi:P27 family predicted phage terminase small subunit